MLRRLLKFTFRVDVLTFMMSNIAEFVIIRPMLFDEQLERAHAFAFESGKHEESGREWERRTTVERACQLWVGMLSSSSWQAEYFTAFAIMTGLTLKVRKRGTRAESRASMLVGSQKWPIFGICQNLTPKKGDTSQDPKTRVRNTHSQTSSTKRLTCCRPSAMKE